MLDNVLLVVHLLACSALVITVMLQRSEGGALGMGGGGAGSGLISGRGVANVLVRTTMILAAVFFATSLVLTRLNTENARAPSDVERELRNREGDIFDPLAAPAPASPAPSTDSSVTPAPVLDPLAPVVAPIVPAPATTAPATTPPATTPSATTAPVVTPPPAATQTPATTPAATVNPAPANPAPPENGG